MAGRAPNDDGAFKAFAGGAFRAFAGVGKSSFKKATGQGRILRKTKELFLSHATELQYTPLPGPSWIRLLMIEPGSTNSVIRCSLHQVDLDTHPAYTALSYTWKEDQTLHGAAYAMLKNSLKSFRDGADHRIEIPQDTGDLNRSKTIICDDNVIKIYPNLYKALIQLRQKWSGEFWIDALCINQNDRSERNAQVQLMGRIYRSAKGVVVWLGSCPDHVVEGIPYLEALTKRSSKKPISRELTEHGSSTTSDVDLQAYRSALGSAGSIVMSQWFRRTWVVQELCWARTVSFALGEADLTLQAVTLSFSMIQDAYSTDSLLDLSTTSEDPPASFIARIGKYAHVWTPQIYHVSTPKWTPRSSHDARAPVTLQAREVFQQGDQWTLTQWLLTCRGRLATDPRDLIFAGLSLVKPELLSIQPDIRGNRPRSTKIENAPLFARRKDYPNQIPPFGVRWDIRVVDHDSTTTSAERWSLANELWPVLKADYDVHIAEVLVNTAACLLTHTGTKEVLSIAARTSIPDTYTSHWWISPADLLDLDGLPSWVPAPGSWTSHVNDLLVPHAGSIRNLANWVDDRYQISHDGTTLALDASTFDTIDTLLFEEKFLEDLSPEEFTHVLTKLSDLADKHRAGHDSPISALSRIFESSKGRETPATSQYAAEWLCHSLAFTVFNNIHLERKRVLLNRPRRQHFDGISSDQFAENLGKYYNTNIDDLLDAFDRVKKAIPDEPWPNWRSPRELDRELHIKHLREEADEDKKREGLPSQTEKRTRKDKKKKEKGSATSAPSRGGEIKPEKLNAAAYPPRDPKLHAKLTASAVTTLEWRKVFITKRGYLGIGPNWLTGGETIMHVRGALVPYVFVPQAFDHKRREQHIRKALDSNDSKYFEAALRLGSKDAPRGFRMKRAEGKVKRLDEERKVLMKKLGRLEQERKQEDAWVLQGEVYIDGCMGENVKLEEPWRKIRIV